MIKKYIPNKRSLGWLIITFLMLSIITIVGLREISRVAVVDERSFSGKISVGGQTVSVHLPKGVKIDAVLPSIGDEVLTKQTLATLNQQHLENQIVNLEEDILALTMERECLLDPRNSLDPPIWTDGTKPELGSRLSLAIETCLNFLDRLKVPTLPLVRELRLFQERLDLLSKRTSLAMAAGPIDRVPQQAGLAIAQTLVAQNELKLEISKKRARLDRLNLSVREAKVKAATALTNEITGLRAQLSDLHSLQKAPRIQSPVKGIVQRIRIPNGGMSSTYATDIIHISLTNPDQISLSMDVPMDLQSTLKKDDVVKFQILGNARRANVYSATISDRHRPSNLPGHYNLPLLISEKDLSELRTNDGLSALSNPASVADIRVKLGKKTLLQRVKDVLTSLVNQDIRAFSTQLYEVL